MSRPSKRYLESQLKRFSCDIEINTSDLDTCCKGLESMYDIISKSVQFYGEDYATSLVAAYCLPECRRLLSQYGLSLCKIDDDTTVSYEHYVGFGKDAGCFTTAMKRVFQTHAQNATDLLQQEEGDEKAESTNEPMSHFETCDGLLYDEFMLLLDNTDSGAPQRTLDSHLLTSAAATMHVNADDVAEIPKELETAPSYDNRLMVLENLTNIAALSYALVSLTQGDEVAQKAFSDKGRGI